MDYTIRHATRSDGIAIINIFNFYVKNTFAAHSSTPVGQYYFTQIWQMAENYPFLVVESEEKEVVGYGLLTDYHPAPAFKGTVEVSYFISPEHIRQGHGTKLLKCLPEEASKQDLKTVLASVNSLNEGAVAFHLKNGFTECGRFLQVGQKLDRRFDVIWLQQNVD